MEQIDSILHYWFGNAEKEALPSEHRIWIWFSHDLSLEAEVKNRFEENLLSAAQGKYDDWKDSPRGGLALIILLDQFSRRIYYNSPMSFAQDSKALRVCLDGIDQSYDHQLSLIERVFFYFPLMHAESLDMQTLSVRAYQMLATIAFAETRPLFERFLEQAISCYDQIKRFNRFPDRNEILNRNSTEAELAFLKHEGDVAA
jgi:uncharacterized protein (DUF924 family)